MDLFTTFIRLAGKEIPQDRIIDGGDLRQDLGIVSEAAVTVPSEAVFEFSFWKFGFQSSEMSKVFDLKFILKRPFI